MTRVAVACVVVATFAACTGAGAGTDDAGVPIDAGNDVDAGSNNDATPAFTEAFAGSGDWVGWTCAPFQFNNGLASEADGVGQIVPVNQSRMDCAIDNAIVDVDLVVDVAFNPQSGGFPGDPVAADEAIVVSVRRHLIGNGQPWDVDEIDALIGDDASGNAVARFVTALDAQQGDPSILQLAPIGPAVTTSIPIANPDGRARLRVRVEGAAPTRLRMKVWPASLAEPFDWLVDETLAGDASFTKDDFGIALNAAYDGASDAPPVQFAHLVVYDATTTSADQALAPP